MDWVDGKRRCCWANPKNERYIRYHDEEWGVPVHDYHKLFDPKRRTEILQKIQEVKENAVKIEA